MTIAAVAALSALAACSDDPSSGDDGTTTVADTTPAVPSADDPCTLLTTAEVSELMRKPMDDGTPSAGTEGPMCQWVSTDPPSEGLDSPTHLTLLIGTMTPEVQSGFDQLVADTENNVVVEGLGDQAVAHCPLDTDNCDELYVVVGERFVAVDMGNWVWPGDYDPSEVIDIVKGAAELVLPRLG